MFLLLNLVIFQCHVSFRRSISQNLVVFSDPQVPCGERLANRPAAWLREMSWVDKS